MHPNHPPWFLFYRQRDKMSLNVNDHSSRGPMPLCKQLQTEGFIASV